MELSTADLAVLIGLLANVEAALGAEDPGDVMPHLLDRMRRDLTSLGLAASADPGAMIQAVAAMNARLRVAIGEPPAAT
jgi:hypothetical protein